MDDYLNNKKKLEKLNKNQISALQEQLRLQMRHAQQLRDERLKIFRTEIARRETVQARLNDEHIALLNRLIAMNGQASAGVGAGYNTSYRPQFNPQPGFAGQPQGMRGCPALTALAGDTSKPTEFRGADIGQMVGASKNCPHERQPSAMFKVCYCVKYGKTACPTPSSSWTYCSEGHAADEVGPRIEYVLKVRPSAQAFIVLGYAPNGKVPDPPKIR